MFRFSLVSLLALSACSYSDEAPRETSQPANTKSLAGPDSETLAAASIDAQSEVPIPIAATSRAQLRVLGMT